MMNRGVFHVLAAIALSAAAPGLNAQTLSAGVYGGVNIARAETSLDGSSPQTGLVVGAAFEVELFSPLAFRAEAQFVQKGGTLEFTSSQGFPSTSADYTLNYLELPINLKFDIGSEQIPLYVFAGTTVGTLLSAVAREETEGSDSDVGDAFKSFDLSLDLGGGIGYRLASHLTTVADIRYSLGLTDIAKESNQLLAADSWKTRNIKIVLGLYVGL